MIIVYAVWFIFFQDVIQFILENAISTNGGGEKDPITGWLGIFFLPFLGVIAILGLSYPILLLIERKKREKKPQLILKS